LETRRLKLFIVAYLRGFLAPNYKNGIKSRIRENLILGAINDDLDAKSLANSLSVDLAFASSLPREDLSGHYDTIYDKISDIRELDELSGLYKDKDSKYDDEVIHAMYKGIKSKTKKDKQILNSVEDLMELYKFLESSGLMTKLVKTAKEL